MNQYITFNGVSSGDIGPNGLIIEKMPDEIKPARNIEEYSIPGRDGRQIEDLGGYDLYKTQIKINCNGADLTDVYAWLDGEGWMVTSDDPEYMRYAGFCDQINDQRFRAGTCFDTITVPVYIQPYKYLAVQEDIELAEPAVFSGQGNQNALPVIEITGSGDITLMVNGSSVLINDLDGTIILDCDTETPYMEINGDTVFSGRKITVVDDEWPYLEPGTNSVNWSGQVSKLVIHPWWRWI